MDDRARHAVPPHASPRRSNRRRGLAVMAAVSLLVAACGGGPATPTLSGMPASAVASTSPVLASSSPSGASSPSGEPTPAPTDGASSSPASTASSSPSPSPSGPAVSPAPTHLPGPAGTPGTVTGARGTVWDALPASFPVYPGLEPAPLPGTPASATLATTGISGQALIAWYGPALAAAGYTVDAPSAPLEDGSRRLTAHRTGQAGCAVDVTIGAKGTMTFVTIGYGAACAFS